MDNKLIKQYGEEILCYRLRTKRNKIKAQYEDFHKGLIQIHKEEKELYGHKQNLGWEPLVPPVQKGWKRQFVLRQDVARSKQAAFYSSILVRINTVQWSYRKDFMKKKRAFGRKKYVVREQYLLKPDEYYFQKLGFSEVEKAQFHEQWSYEKCRGRFIKHYVFNEPWRFMLKVLPNVVDKTRKTDPVTEARLKEIDEYLERNSYRPILTKLLDGNNYRYWETGEKYNEVSPIKNKPLQKILDEVKHEMI
jgi:hypothetical protein